MAKAKSAGGSASEAAKKGPAKKAPAAKGPAKKTPAPTKPAAKKPAPATKPAAKPAAKKPATKKSSGSSSAQAELPIAPVEVVEDAEIIAETLAVAGTIDADLSHRQTEEVTPVDEPALTPEERELAAIYAGDLQQPAIAHAEYADRQTADEDRPMVPEINARDERKQQWQERRDQRRQRRDQRNQQRHERQGQRPTHPGGGQAQGQAGQGGQSGQVGQSGRGDHQRPERNDRNDRNERNDRSERNDRNDRNDRPNGNNGQPRPAQSLPPITTITTVAPAPNAPAAAAIGSAEHDALGRVGTPLGDAAATVFAQLRNGQPLPVKQLASMMRKRSLTEVDPEQLWPQLKAELLGDERSYRALGLRPRIVYRGRDLFAPGPVVMSQTAEAEASVAAALSRLAGATHRALAARLARATAAGFERIIHAYLVAAGFREIAWVKRVNNIAYAQAIAPGIERPVLISARAGEQPIDRRGIGELRVGVEAKDLIAGILFSARELSEDAERELERAGRSISVMCGDQLVAALIAAGVGVVSAAAPVHYVDDQLLDELLAG